jgi:hypothetical protein
MLHCMEYGVAYLNQLANKKNGQCLSPSFLGVTKKHQWRCLKGHEWYATPHNIRHGKWCPFCAGRYRTIADMQALAIRKGGKCLSPAYIHSHKPLLWICAEGHEWLARPNNIINGTWCPICAQGISETICRTILENAFGRSFPKKKPTWLTNSRGARLELDGYCEEFKLAFEYNGEQHYEKSRHFHRRSETAFDLLRKDDVLKVRLCKQMGVNLIVIPYTVSLHVLANFIFERAKQYGYKVGREKFIWDSSSVYHSRAQLIKKMKEIANSRGGRCLSKRYINSVTKLEWQCEKKHTWYATPQSITQSSWCPYCHGYYRTIEEMREFAKSKDGLCLSKKFTGMNRKLKWQCAKGHRWNALASSVFNYGTWCPVCLGRHTNIQDVRRLATSRGGLCLSSHFSRSDTKYLWKCKEGHLWSAKYNNVQQGQWCPTCAGKARGLKQLGYTIKDMRALAQKNCGFCESDTYLGAQRNLKWRCSEGHVWLSTPTTVRRGGWCKTCRLKAAWRRRKKSKYP